MASYNKADLEKVKKKLLDLRAQISGSIRETKEEVKEMETSKGYSQHQADEGTDDFVKNISLDLSNKELGIIKQIDRALEKIDEGTYGVCDVSGKDIPKARLEVLPYATMTVDSQEKFEKGLI